MIDDYVLCSVRGTTRTIELDGRRLAIVNRHRGGRLIDCVHLTPRTARFLAAMLTRWADERDTPVAPPVDVDNALEHLNPVGDPHPSTSTRAAPSCPRIDTKEGSSR